MNFKNLKDKRLALSKDDANLGCAFLTDKAAFLVYEFFNL